MCWVLWIHGYGCNTLSSSVDGIAFELWPSADKQSQKDGSKLLAALEEQLTALREPVLPFKNSMQLLGAADNPQLQPFVLRLLLRRIVPYSYGEL